MVENLAVTTGAAVALAGHFSKGNASAKESIDRISGSGVFARDPDSLITFTKHEEEGAFTVEMTLRNLPSVNPFVVRWEWPLFKPADEFGSNRLKQTGGRPATYTPEMLLECLGRARLTTAQWKELASEEHGFSGTRFFALKKALSEAGKVHKSKVDGKWEQTKPDSRNWYNEKDQ